MTVKPHFKTLYVGLSCAVYKYNKLGPLLQSADTLRARYHKLVLVMVTLCIRYEYVRHALYIRIFSCFSVRSSVGCKNNVV